MDAFESVIAAILDRKGFWTRTEFKVELTKQDKRDIGRPSSPRWEIDVVAYKPGTNELRMVECKSYLDSPGVAASSFADDADTQQSKRFKLFREEVTRDVVSSRLVTQLREEGLCLAEPRVTLCLAAGRILNEPDRLEIARHFKDRGWLFMDPEWIKEEITTLAKSGYENSIAAVTAKVLLR